MKSFFALLVAFAAIFAILHINAVAGEPLLGSVVNQDLTDLTKVSGIGNSVTELVDADLGVNAPISLLDGGLLGILGR